MSNEVPIEENLYLDENGVLREQDKTAKTPRSLSHINRQRIDNGEVLRIIAYLTGLSMEELAELIYGVCIKWMEGYLNVDEADVYRLMACPLVMDWWHNCWHNRDREWHLQIAAVYRYYSSVARRFEPDADIIRSYSASHTQLYYLQLIQGIFDTRTNLFKRLEESYMRVSIWNGDYRTIKKAKHGKQVHEPHDH